MILNDGSPVQGRDVAELHLECTRVLADGEGTPELGGSFAICEDTCALEMKFGHVPPLNRAPIVQDHASDVTGLEGDTLTTDGSLTDPDGDALTISGSGAGTVADLGNGRW